MNWFSGWARAKELPETSTKFYKPKGRLVDKVDDELDRLLCNTADSRGMSLLPQTHSQLVHVGANLIHVLRELHPPTVQRFYNRRLLPQNYFLLSKNNKTVYPLTIPNNIDLRGTWISLVRHFNHVRTYNWSSARVKETLDREQKKPRFSDV